MEEIHNWNWETGSREVADINECNQTVHWVEEPYVSPDGEKIAAIVNLAEGEFNVCVNGKLWETVFEKIWHLRFDSRVDPGPVFGRPLCAAH